MKKTFITLSFVLICGLAWAVADSLNSVQYAGDQVIKSGRAIIADVSIYYVGVTAGNKVELLNGTSASATPFLTVVAPAAAGTFAYTPTTAILVDSGIYIKETKSGGAFGTNLQYQ